MKIQTRMRMKTSGSQKNVQININYGQYNNIIQIVNNKYNKDDLKQFANDINNKISGNILTFDTLNNGKLVIKITNKNIILTENNNNIKTSLYLDIDNHLMDILEIIYYIRKLN